MCRESAARATLSVATHRTFRSLAGLLAAATLASACGGGGSGGVPECIATHEEGCLPPAEFEERATALAGEFRDRTDFSNQWGLATINADEAYAHLALVEGEDVRPGAGQTIGLIDSGIDEASPLFEGVTITEGFLLGATNERGDRFSHGTAVASVIAASRLPEEARSAHGVAFGADLAVFAIPLGTAPEHYDPVTLEGLENNDPSHATLFRHALAWEGEGGRLDFLNLSFGYLGLIDSYTEAGLRAHYGETIDVLAQNDSEEKTILVWGAGNSHGTQCTQDAPWCVEGEVDATSPGITPGLPVYFEELRGHNLAVVAVGEDGSIADFSNRCGSAAQWCLAAPGEEVLVAYFGPHPTTGAGFRGITTVSGTSLSAPMVTGGLAVMKHYFRGQLSNTALAARLLETADRTGIYADTTVYGRGLMDLGAATSPVGATRVALAGTVHGESTPVAATGLVSGGALGDGLAHSFAGHEIAAFDALGAPFWLDLGDFASVRATPSASARLREFMAPATALHGLGARPVVSLRRENGTWVPGHEEPTGLRLGLLDTPIGAEGGHLGLAEHALTLSWGGRSGLVATAFSTQGADGTSPASGGFLSWRAAGTRTPSGPRIGLRAGWLGEREALLGTSAKGAFGSLAADAVFAGVDAEADLGGWRLFGGAEVGTVGADRTGGLIADLSPLSTSAFAFRATRPLGNDRGLSLSIAQPLRVESGRATLSVPAGRTRNGEVQRRPVSADLSPTGRQVDVTARWHRRWRDGGELRLGAVWTRDPGHRAAADPSLALLAGWRQAF